MAQRLKRLPGMRETWVWSLDREGPLEKEMATTPVFLPGKSYGWRSLADYSPWGHKDLDTIERLHFLSFFFKGFIKFVTILLLFYVLVFWPWGMWDLSSPTRDWTLTSCIGKQSLNHWVTREISAFFFFLCYLWFLSICRLKAKDKSNQGRGVMLRKLRGNDNV